MAYISVNDAVERTGKGQTTIYRFCRKFEHTRHVKREDKKFLIDEEFLSRHLSSAENEQAENTGAAKEKPEMIDVFIEELLNEKRYFRLLLDRKDEQLERKDRMIASLQERQKELHYLLNHQTQLLESARKPEPITEVNTTSESKPAQEPTSSPEQEDYSPSSFHFPNDSANYREEKETSVLYEAKVVYAVLGAVAFMLFMAILFVDDIKYFLDN